MSFYAYQSGTTAALAQEILLREVYTIDGVDINPARRECGAPGSSPLNDNCARPKAVRYVRAEIHCSGTHICPWWDHVVCESICAFSLHRGRVEVRLVESFIYMRRTSS